MTLSYRLMKLVRKSKFCSQMGRMKLVQSQMSPETPLKCPPTLEKQVFQRTTQTHLFVHQVATTQIRRPALLQETTTAIARSRIRHKSQQPYPLQLPKRFPQLESISKSQPRLIPMVDRAA